MTDLIAALTAVAASLDELEASWAVVGGLAVAVHGEPRFTRDVDLAVAVADDAEVDRLIFALHGLRYRIGSVFEHQPTGRVATIRLIPPGPDTNLLVDLLFLSSGIEDQITSMAEDVELIPGLVLPVVRAGHLAAMKALAFDPDTRPKDFADLRSILGTCSEEERALAFEAVSLIEQRGFNRDKDLVSVLNKAISAGPI